METESQRCHAAMTMRIIGMGWSAEGLLSGSLRLSILTHFII